MSGTHVDFLRHLLATLAYRMSKVLDDAPEGFARHASGNGVRTPLEILAHVGDVLAFTYAELTGTEREALDSTDWDMHVVRFRESLAKLDSALRNKDDLKDETAFRLLQGPLSDVMTHIGQLAMIRRSAGAPIPGENFFAADIRAGASMTSRPAS